MTMSSGQNINSIAEAPVGVLDGKAGGNTAEANNPLLAEFTSGAVHHNKESAGALGGLLAETDYGVEQLSHEADEGIANVMGDHTVYNGPELLSQEGSKQFLNVPNPADDIYRTALANKAFNKNSSFDQESFDRLFDAKTA